MDRIRTRAERVAQADRLVADGEALCQRQAAVLQRCWALGSDTAEAEALLVQFELSLTLKRLHRFKILDGPAAWFAPDICPK